MEKPLDVPWLLQTIKSLLSEPAGTRLERLLGLESDVRYAGSTSTRSTRYEDLG